MKDKFKAGDKVRRIEKYRNSNNYPYGDKVLTVRAIENYGGVLFFEGTGGSWTVKYFELAELFEDKLLQSYKLIGTIVYYKSITNQELFPFKVFSVKVTENRIELFEYGEGIRSLNYDEVVERPTSIIVKLNDEYKAIVTNDSIEVGCQTFPISIIDDLVKARTKLD